MKITKSHLKELIRQTIRELKFGSQAQYDAYARKHDIKPGTSVSVGDKKTTHKGKAKISKAAKKKADKFAADQNAKLDAAEKAAKKKSKDKPPFDGPYTKDDKEYDAGGPSYSNVPKGAKSSAQAKGMMRAKALAKQGMKKAGKKTKNLKKLSKLDRANELQTSAEDYNKRANKGKPVQIDTEKHGSITWDQGDPDEKSFFGIDQDGGEVEISYDDVVRVHEGTNLFWLTEDKWWDDMSPEAQSDYLDRHPDSEHGGGGGDKVGGEADKLADKQPKPKPKSKKGPRPGAWTKDDFSGPKDDEGGDKPKPKKGDKHWSKVDRPKPKPKKGGKPTKAPKGGRGRKAFEKPKKPKNPNLADPTKEAPKKYKKGDDKSADLFDKMIDKMKKGVSKTKGKKFKDSYNPKGNLVERKRTTVKEVRMWMKTLEENRYKKTYQSDCRRVAWFVNNSLSEDYESMPKSMRKKWTKAAYGRERYLAKEYLKHLHSKQMNESKLRTVIRSIIKKSINEGPRDFIHHSEAKFLKVWKSHARQAQKLLKKFKWQVEFDTKHKSGYITVTTTKKVYDDVLEILMNNNIKVRG